MITRTYKSYISSFHGFRKEVWWLALIILINRAGTMVIPFMSLYLTEDLGFTLADAGWILTAFGVGSVAGSWIGGRLTDRWGFYPVILWSLALSGVLFIGLQFLHTFAALCIGVFLLMIVADALRPAIFVALNAYSKPENRTRAITLIRLAINLGFSLGPALGGFIITTVGYGGLFWMDGVTCIIAGLLFLRLLDRREAGREGAKMVIGTGSPYRDKPYLFFLLIGLLISFAFMQYFSTIPLYYKNATDLTEDEIGLLLGMNGFLIFLLEMPLVKFFDRPRFSIYGLLSFSTLLFACSFWVLNMASGIGILVVGMLLMTAGEMLNFPFMNRYAMERATEGRSGEYMALFTMIFGVAHIFGHNGGMQLISHFGYRATWYIMTLTLVVAAVLVYWLKKMMDRERVRRPVPEQQE